MSETWHPKAMREAAGVSGAALARTLGVCAATIFRWERLWPEVPRSEWVRREIERALSDHLASPDI